ncbi:MAG TPA: SDR family NAD(P)-dependent oxidoreductase [Oligoflexia bacterium]|nr:SDR family NAD(P)-dependent oxidoreductase [Oligoflexia bacterium]
MLSVKGLIVFITGASSGIGEACAHVFAEQGARLVVCARRMDRLQKLDAELRAKYGVELLALQLDVRSHAKVHETISGLPENWREIDVIINNAGLAVGKDKLHEARVEHWEQMIDTNVKGLLYVTREILPGMVARNRGHVINIGSIAGHEAYSGGSVYCATKSAVRSISRALQMDVLGSDVRVSSVDPGFTDTEFSLVRFGYDRTAAEEVYRGMRPLSAADIADAVLYCATRPAHVNISEMLILPTDMASATQIYRRT